MSERSDAVSTEPMVADVAAPLAVPANAAVLPVHAKATYAVGDIAEGLQWAALNTFLLFYLTAVCGLSGWLAGIALFVSMAVDAVADPLIGYLSDNARLRLGRRHPFLFVSAAPWFLFFGLLFSTPPIESDWALFAYVVTMLIGLRVAHSAFHLPMSALGAEIVRDYRDRSVLSSMRAFFNITGNLACVTLGFGLFMRDETRMLSRAAYAGFGWTCAAVAVCAILICAVGTLPLRGRMHVIRQHQPLAPARFVREVAEVVRNRSFRILFLTALIFWTAQGAAIALGLHVNKFFWQLPPDAIQLVPTWTALGMGAAVFVGALLLRRFAKHHVCVGGIIVYCAVQLLPVTLRVTGIFTLNGAPLAGLLGTCAFITGCAVSCAIIAFGAMMSDSADEHEHLFGSRREGLYFSGLTFSGKAALGMGALISGLTLDLVGFPRDLASLGPHAQIPWTVARNLALLAGPGAAAIAMMSALILARYQLDARKLARIQSDLAHRRRASAP